MFFHNCIYSVRFLSPASVGHWTIDGDSSKPRVTLLDCIPARLTPDRTAEWGNYPYSVIKHRAVIANTLFSNVPFTRIGLLHISGFPCAYVVYKCCKYNNVQYIFWLLVGGNTLDFLTSDILGYLCTLEMSKHRSTGNYIEWNCGEFTPWTGPRAMRQLFAWDTSRLGYIWSRH